eukprot:471293_1
MHPIMNSCVVILILHTASVATDETYPDELCETSEECIGSTLRNSGRTVIYGYNAASGPMTSFSGGSISCRGAYSCHSMSFMHAKSGDITCSGSNACSNTTIQSNATIRCEGAHSCMNSNILSSPTIYCRGSRSCESANVTGVVLIYGNGMLALYKAAIDTISSAVSVITIYLQSHLSAYGASLICREQHECNIHCQSADACYMFYVDCIGICEIHRDVSDYHNPTNDWNLFISMNYSNITLYQPFDYNMIRLESLTNSLCTAEKWRFDDGYANHNIIVTINNTVCCRGYQSCNSVEVIEYKTQSNKDLICSAGFACDSVEVIDDTVFCQGRSSCYRSVMDDVDDVYCTGYSACTRAVITGATNILCHGMYGCSLTTVISGGNDVNIYALASLGAAGMNIYCNDTDTCVLHCIGYKSCFENVNILCHGNCAVHCYDESSLCPTYFNSTSAATNVSFKPSFNWTTSTTFLSTFYTTMHLYTSIQIDEGSKEPHDAVVVIIVIAVSSIVCVVTCWKFRSKMQRMESATENQAEPGQFGSLQRTSTTDIDLHENDKGEEEILNKEGDGEGMNVNKVNKQDGNGEGNDEVRQWLESVGFAQYYDHFVRNGMNDLKLIQSIAQKSDLEYLGITLKGHQIVIMNKINELSEASEGHQIAM